MFFVNQKSVIHSEYRLLKKRNTVAYGNRGMKDGNVERVDGVAFPMQEAQLVNKGDATEETVSEVECHEKSSKTIAYGNRTENGINIERKDEVSFTTMEMAGGENVKKPEKKTGNNEDLRRKLWEILSTAPSQNKDIMNSPEIAEFQESLFAHQSMKNKKGEIDKRNLNSPNFEENIENLNVNQNTGYRKDKPTRLKLNLRELKDIENLNIKQSRETQKGETTIAKQKSGIETDFISPNKVIQRPGTRSLTRTETQLDRRKKMQGNASCGKKPLASFNSDFKFKHGKENKCAFADIDKKAGSLSFASNMAKDQKATKIEPGIICFPRSISKKSLQNSDEELTMLSSHNASSENKKRDSSSLPHQDKKQPFQPLGGRPNDNHHSQINVQLNIHVSPLPAYNKEIRENTDSPSFKMKTHSLENESSSPEPKTFLHANVSCQSIGKESDELDSFQSPRNLSPTSPSTTENEILYSYLAAPVCSPILKSNGSKYLDNSTPRSSQSDTGTESSDESRDTPKWRHMDCTHANCEESGKQFYLNPVEEQYIESETDEFMSRGHISAPEGIDEIIGSFKALEQTPESSLAWCVAQSTSVLESFRARMESQTRKRCSHVLYAAADKIQQRLEDVEFKIMADLGMFNNIGKSKRKRTEIKLQEQKERLKLAHEKYREEVNQHLSDCMDTVEELDAFNVELKKNLDKQKASHKKLLLEVKEAMEVQINDAEKTIALIYKDSREKMIGLKQALKEWMN